MGDVQRPADLLGGILRQAKTDAGKAPTVRALDEVLGPEVAAHCSVRSERGGRLLIDVDSAPLFAELQSFRREEVRRSVNARLSSAKFADVVFRFKHTGNV